MITTDIELAILRKYAAGAELPTITKELGIDHEQTAAAVSQLAGFQRGRARELVRQHEAAHQSPATPKPAQQATPKPSPLLAPSPSAELEVKVEPRTDGSRSPVEAILTRAKVAGGRYAKRAEKIREQVVALDAELAEYQHVIDAEKRVEELRRQLDEANTKLRQLKGGRPAVVSAPVTPASGPTPREVRAWAKEAGVECGPLARIPAHVMDAYQVAHGRAA